jgi:hypothetical protein
MLAMSAPAAYRPAIGCPLPSGTWAASLVFSPAKVPKLWVDGAVRDGAPRFTLYASAVDKAMLAGYVVEWGTVLAGHATNGEPLLHPKVESIDISEAGTFGLFDLNHDVFASNPVMSEDMRQLLQTGQRPPGKRISALGERKGRRSGAVYWHYRRP